MMKNILFVLIAALTVFAAAAKKNNAKIAFKTEVHDFGYVQESKGDVSYDFEFSNVGTEPLIVLNARASCGCTVPEYPRNPIKPGEKGVIKVTFRTAHQAGHFDKNVTVKTNTEIKRLRIKGNVIPSVVK